MHPGNRTYRKLVNSNKGFYATCHRLDKQKISRSIVAAIRKQGRRFLKREKGVIWVDIGDAKAIEKTAQALREGRQKTVETIYDTMLEIGQIEVSPSVEQVSLEVGRCDIISTGIEKKIVDCLEKKRKRKREDGGGYQSSHQLRPRHTVLSFSSPPPIQQQQQQQQPHHRRSSKLRIVNGSQFLKKSATMTGGNLSICRKYGTVEGKTPAEPSTLPSPYAQDVTPTDQAGERTTANHLLLCPREIDVALRDKDLYPNAWKHPGNRSYLESIRINSLNNFFNSKAIDHHIACTIVDNILRRGGRFLTWSNTNTNSNTNNGNFASSDGAWQDLGEESAIELTLLQLHRKHGELPRSRFDDDDHAGESLLSLERNRQKVDLKEKDNRFFSAQPLQESCGTPDDQGDVDVDVAAVAVADGEETDDQQGRRNIIDLTLLSCDRGYESSDSDVLLF